MKKITDYIYQNENFLNCVKPCTLIINLDDYDLEDSININQDDGTIWVKNLISRIIFNDLEFHIILDYAVTVQINEMVKDGKEIRLSYPAQTIILEASLEVEDVKKQVAFVERLMGGREIFKDVDHLILKLNNAFKDVSGMDLVHQEVLISNALRDKNNLSIPARLGKKWNPVLINMKDIVFQSGFVQGLAFENIGKSINTGLISEVSGEKTILEKVLTGTIVEKKK